MLREWERQHPGRVESIFTALSNLTPSHLLDRSQFDFTKIAATNEPRTEPIHISPRMFNP
jgi:tRNA 2-thiocytidine biosynthesis protein TtcA